MASLFMLLTSGVLTVSVTVQYVGPVIVSVEDSDILVLLLYHIFVDFSKPILCHGRRGKEVMKQMC
jgi:hypothetical protein